MKLQTTIALSLLLGIAAVRCEAQSAKPEERRYTGKVIRSFTEPYRKSIVSSAVTGVVVDATAKEGDRVGVGDPLVRLNTRVLEASLAIAKTRAQSTARVNAAESQYILLKSQLEALKKLDENGHTNRYELQQKQSEYRRAFSDYQAAKDEQKLAELDVDRIAAELENRTIRSPINGFIIKIHKQPGEQLSTTEPQYATVVSLEKLRVRFYMTVDLLSKYRVGDLVVVDVGKQREKVRGTVSYVSRIIDSDSGVGRIEVLLDNEKLTLRSGIPTFWNGSARRKITQRSDTPRLPVTSNRAPTSSRLTPARVVGQRTSSAVRRSDPSLRSNR